MDTYRTALFLHIISLGIGFGAASVLAVCLFQLRAAKTLAEAVPWGTVAGVIEKAFPVAILGLFATGAYMTQHFWTWDTGWIDVSIVAFAVVALQGPLVGGRAGHKLKEALQANGPGQLGPEALRLARHPTLWIPEFANIGLVFGIVWDMTQKPGTGEAIAAVVVGYALGVLVATRFTGVEAQVAVAEPAA
jgi:prolipoprotein diacylglyceryltransferase